MKSFAEMMRGRPVILAPLEGYSDLVFRRICRARGAEITLTEFINVENLLHGNNNALRKIKLAEDDVYTAIQIYGSNPDTLEQAAHVAEAAEPFYLDINCGCWVPKIAARGAGSGWLRNPTAMVEMAKRIVAAVSLPVTVKTRIGFGPESEMPIIDLARRLEDVGVKAITIHCRTAKMGHNGEADWTWAQRAREVVNIPVIVNGDIRSGEDCVRALELTGCEGVMIGRHAIAHPWVFREARSLLDHGVTLAPPTREERLQLAREHLAALVDEIGEEFGVPFMRKHYKHYFAGLDDAEPLRHALNRTDSAHAALGLLA